MGGGSALRLGDQGVGSALRWGWVGPEVGAGNHGPPNGEAEKSRETERQRKRERESCLSKPRLSETGGGGGGGFVATNI